MDVAALFLYARTSLDSDSTELPDTLLGAWLNAAENRIYAALKSAERLWSAKVTVTAAGSTQAYTTSTVTEPRVVSGPQWELVPIPHDFALERWPRNRTAGAPIHFGLSTHWSIDEIDGKMWLWPAPTNGDTYLVTGLTTPVVTVFTTTTNVPALPVRYHVLLGEYLVARGAEMQQNLSLASMKLGRFEAELDVMVRNDLRPSAAGVTAVGSARLRAPNVTPGRLSWPWE